MTTLLIKLMESKSQRDIDKIIEQNICKVNPFNQKFFCSEANQAKRRMMRKIKTN